MSEAKNNDKKNKKGNILKIVIIVLLLLILIGGTVFATYYFVVSRNGSNKSSAEQEVEITENMFSLDDFLVNLADEKGKRYLKVKIYIGYEENKDLAAELELKKPILRDSAIGVLRDKKSEDIDAHGSELLKNELLIKLNSNLTKGKVRNVYFYDILVQ